MKSQSIQQQQAAIVRNQARICDLLHWTMAVYSNFMYNTGLQYLDEFVGEEEAINMLTPRAEFWNWWKNLFSVRDEAFVREWDGMEDSIGMSDLRTIYMDLHRPGVLACEIHPPRIAFPENFTSIKMELA